MAVDILSKQPTRVPDHLSDPTRIDLDAENVGHLLFNTHNLTLAGSPAGFFLLLRKAQLTPRIDSNSAAAQEDPTALTDTICGQQGQYGCLAVENIYNVINGYDPVAYRQNAISLVFFHSTPSRNRRFILNSPHSSQSAFLPGLPARLNNDKPDKVPKSPVAAVRA